VGRPRWELRRVVLANGTAEHHPSAHGEPGEAGIQDVAADVVEVHVDAVGRDVVLQIGGHGPRLVVDASVEPELIHDEPALLFTAGDAYDFRGPLYPGDLADRRPRRAGGT